MVTFTQAQWIQLLAVLSVPALFLTMLFARTTAGASFKWKQVRMVAVVALAPVVIVLVVRNLITTWMALGSLAVLAVLFLLVNSSGD
ncbi:MAG: hypothetical protein ABEJ42_09965 [Halobacteriaceae archaeon]